MAITLNERQRRYLRWAAYPVVGVFTFVLAAFYTFPYDRLKEKIVTAMSGEYEVTIDSLEPSLMPGTFVLKNFIMRSRPSNPDEKPTVIAIDELEVDVGVLALLRGRFDVDLVAEIAGGSIEGNITVADNLSVDITTNGLPLGGLPGLRGATGGAPLEGGLDAHVELTLPKRKWKDADGVITLACSDCSFGDGVAKIKPRAPEGRTLSAFAAEGVTMPRLHLGVFIGQIDIDGGKGKISKFEAVSKDGEMFMEGELNFADPFKTSVINACIRYKYSDELKERESSIVGMETGQEPARRADGYLGASLGGKLGATMWRPTKNCRVGGTGREEREPPRPRIGRRQPQNVDDGSGEPSPREPLAPPVEPPSEPAPQEPPHVEPLPSEPPPPMPEPGSSGPTRARDRRDDVRAMPEGDNGNTPGSAEPTAPPEPEPAPEPERAPEPEQPELEAPEHPDQPDEGETGGP